MQGRRKTTASGGILLQAGIHQRLIVKSQAASAHFTVNAADKQAWFFPKKVTCMNTKILISVAAATMIALTGCGTNPTNAQIGTATGAVLGGVAGSAVSGGSTLGTVGGAAAGALIGNEVGKKR